MYLTLLLAVGIFPNFIRCAVRPVEPLHEGSVDTFLHGIDRLCDATRFSEVLLLSDEETDPTGVDSGLKARLGAHRPVSLRSLSLLGKSSANMCLVGFFSTTEMAQDIAKHLDMMALFVAVLPEDMLEPMSNLAGEMYLCVLYYFAYSRTTLTGSCPMYMGHTFTFVPLPDMSQMCIVVPRSQRKSIFAILIDPFDYTSWAAFALTIGVVSFVLALFGESYRRLNVGLISLELLMTAINGPTRRYGGRFEVRIMGLFMMMNIVLFSSYQSLVISFMSTGRYEPELNTLDQINDTCQFPYDAYHEGVLGYRFRHNLHTFEKLLSAESRWKHKVCQVSLCYGKDTAGMESDDTYFPHLFRTSKVRLHSTVTMYAIKNYSPMRRLIKHYTVAFFEGHLHSFPQLLAGKANLAGQHETIYDLKVEASSNRRDTSNPSHCVGESLDGLSAA
uniref:Ionotropic glutamate receptor C-terminal domain-containing protein n=1 Tax=Anopheles atroparvus TaxID=41427 RepID=A0A182IL45_ANOAO